MTAEKWNGFKGEAKRLESIDISRLAHSIGAGEDEVHAFMEVEAAGAGFDKLGRPKVLRETHKFYKHLGKGAKRDRAVKLGLATPRWVKNYKKDSYPDLLKMMEIDETAALMSCSWGRGQIMGENHLMAGYPTVQAMVRAFMEDEENHLQGMINFIVAAGIDDDLRRLADLKRPTTADDCRPIVRVYNGSGYEKNDYHTKFAKAHNKWRGIKDTPWMPEEEEAVVVQPGMAGSAAGDTPIDVAAVETTNLYDGKYHPEIEAVQKRLNNLGYPEFGECDGKWGTKTRAAILAFRADNSLPLTPTVDDKLMAALMIATPRYVNPARANATVADLREKGAEEIKSADITQVAGGVAAATGVVTGAGTVLEQFEEYGGMLERAAEVIAPFKDFLTNNALLLLIGVGGVVIWQAWRIKKIRVEQHQTAKNVAL